MLELDTVGYCVVYQRKVSISTTDLYIIKHLCKDGARVRAVKLIRDHILTGASLKDAIALCDEIVSKNLID
jgi:hypothetical protein